MLQPEKETNNFLPENEVTTLPSSKLSYPPNAKITYSPFTFGEIIKFTQSNMDDLMTLEFILEGIKCNFDKSLLTYFDVIFIGILRKVATFGGSQAEIRTICPECGEAVTTLINVDELDFEDLEYTELPINIKINGQILEFSFMTYTDKIELSKMDVITAIDVLAMQVKNMTFEKAKEIISSVSNADDLQALEEIDKLLYHGVKPIQLTCKNNIEVDDVNTGEHKLIPCGNKFTVEADTPEVFVKPFREDGEPIRNRISFGNK